MRLKSRTRRSLGVMAFMAAAFIISASGLQAQTFNLFVHGLSNQSHCAPINHTSDAQNDVNGYWAGINMTGVPNLRYVGFAPNASGGAFSWDPCGAQDQLNRALNTFCRKFNGHSCRIYTHSTGGLVAARFLEYLQSAAIAHHFDIQYVRLMANASGGAELASVAHQIQFIPWAVGPNAVRDSVRIGPARNTFNHNRTAGETIWLTSGEGRAWYWSITRPFLRGTNDSVLSNHTLCGVNVVHSYRRCPIGNGPVQKSLPYTSYDNRWDNHRTSSASNGYRHMDHSASRAQF